MRNDQKETLESAAATGLGASLGSAAGATIGILELAANGLVTELSANLVIGTGALLGGLAFLGGYKALRRMQKSKSDAGHTNGAK